jgi:hypothetical protein
MATGNLFGTGGESNSLYGNSLSSGQILPNSFIYFEWFIFRTSSAQPATPTGGSWNFLTNVGTAPTGWTSFITGIPLDSVWLSIAFVDSRSPTNIVWSEPGLISATTSIYATAYADTFTGDGIDTTWTLTQDPVAVNNLDVSINGVTQVPVVDYTISGTTFTTTTPAPLGSVILVKYRQALPNSYFGAASNVGYTPFSWIAASNVQAALNEVATDISATDGVSGSNLVGYKAAGTGAVATTVQAKLREWVSPQDFGALGDSNASGSTGTNDSAAFALLEAYQTGGVVNMNDKFYLVSSPIPTKNNYINGKFVLANGTTYDQPNNLSLGTDALFSNTFVPLQWPAGGGIDYASGNYNTAIGDNAMRGNTTGRRNTALGSFALYTNSTGYYNTAIGPLAMYSNIDGGENTAVGVQASQSNTSGSDNVSVGSGAMAQHSTSNDCVAIGRQALQIAPASTARVVAIGRQAAYQYSTGTDAIAIGYQALSAPGAVGSYNIAIGSASLGATTTGNSNVAVGRRAANATTTGTGNVALGNDAMVGSGLPCTGSNNVAVGNTAAPNIQAGYQNVAVGASAGAALSGGFDNTFVGRFAGQAITSGSGNVAIGEQALSGTTTGDYNTALGSGTVGGAAYTNTTLLGYQATVTGSNQVQLGNASTTSYAYGAVQNRSDARDKTEVRATVLGLDFINSLRPVDFKWDMRDDYRSEQPEPIAHDASNEEKEAYKAAVAKWVEDNKLSNLNPDGSKKRNRYHHGLIAQEVKAAITASGVDFGGFQDHAINGGQDVMSIGYEELIAPLIKAVQQLSAEVAELRGSING